MSHRSDRSPRPAGRPCFAAVVAPLAAFALAACGGGGGDGGIAPDPTPLAPIQTAGAVLVSDVGSAARLYTGTLDGMINARPTAVDLHGRIHVVWFDPGTGLRHSRSLDGGASFLPSQLLVDVATAPTPTATVACARDTVGDVFVVYRDGSDQVRCLRSVDGGRTWPAAGVGTGLSLRGAYGYSVAVSGDVVIVSEAPVARSARSTDRGASFTMIGEAVMPTGLNTTTFAHPLEPSTFVAVGDLSYGYARKSLDGGLTWGTEAGPELAPLAYASFAMDSQGDCFGVGAMGVVVRLAAGPMTFSLPTGVLPVDDQRWSLRTLGVDGEDAIWAVSNREQALGVQVSYDAAASFSKPLILDGDVGVAACPLWSGFPGVGVVYERDGAIYYQHP